MATRNMPDPRQVAALQTQLGILESMLRPVAGGGAVPNQPPNNVVPMPARATALPNAQQAGMQQQMLESMLGGLDPQRAAHIRSLMAVSSRPNVTPQEMEAAVGPLMAQLSPQDQGTVRMMMSMMQQQGHQAGGQPQPAMAVAAPTPPPYALPAEVQQMLDTSNARAVTALEEARRVAADLVSIKDTQNQTTAAMHQQTLVMRDLLNMLKSQQTEAVDDVDESVKEEAVG